MKLFSLFILFTIPSFYAQNIKGLVTDTNNKPISEVNIKLKGIGIGTITNRDGKFSFNIPKKNNKQYVVFSCLGYETKNFSILELKKTPIIILKKKIIELDEVVIKRKNKLTANEIVKKAFENYYTNFPEKPHITKGFLRYTERTNKEYKWLIESTLDLYDPSIPEISENIKLNVKEVRKSFDNRVVDTLIAYDIYLVNKKGLSYRNASKFVQSSDYDKLSKKELKKAITYDDNKDYEKSILYKNLKNIFSKANILRNYNQKNAVFTDKTLFKKLKFKLDTILNYNGNDIYKIKIASNKPSIKLNKKLKKNFFLFGWLYIRADDFAIFEFDYTLVNSKRIQIYTNLTNSKIASSFKIKFIEFNGKMYPNYLVYKKSKINRIRDSFKAIDNKTNNDDIHYFTKLEVLFTKIITDKEKINIALQQKWDNNLFKPRPYHANFWKDYNVLLESKEQKRMRQDLEKKVSLKQQYQNN